jgi:hypothetical protein
MPGIRRGVYAAAFVLFGLGTAVVLWTKSRKRRRFPPMISNRPNGRKPARTFRRCFGIPPCCGPTERTAKTGRSFRRVVIGHKDLTPDFQTRMADYRRFCALRNEEEKARILDRYGVTDILIGPLDERSGCRVGPGCEAVYRNDLFTLYRQARQP